MSVHMCICVCVYIYACLCIQIKVCMCDCIHVNLYVCSVYMTECRKDNLFGLISVD